MQKMWEKSSKNHYRGKSVEGTEQLRKVKKKKQLISSPFGNKIKRKRRGNIDMDALWKGGKKLEAALYLLLPLEGLGSVLGAEAVGPLGGLEVEEAILVGFPGGAGQVVALTHSTHLPRDKTELKSRGKIGLNWIKKKYFLGEHAFNDTNFNESH
jgi:hypothetical protein